MAVNRQLLVLLSVVLRIGLGLEFFKSASPGKKLPNVVIAPAQFGVPKDYVTLVAALKARGHEKVIAAPLTRFDWLKITPSLLTKEYWRGELKPVPTLEFFYEALDRAFDQAEEDEEDISVLAHSIGGWVVRSYIAERKKKVRKIVTLGTPHLAPDGIDQTRGLVDFINQNYPADDRLTSVIGNTSTAFSVNDLFQKKIWDSTISRSPLLESLVALPSYAVLAGTADPFDIRGDGLIPIESTVLPEPARTLVIDETHHSGFIPTALDSIQLPDTYEWYGSPSKVELWAHALL